MAASQLGYTPGSGAQVATDQDSGGAHHQKALTEHLLEGVPTPTSDANPMPVKDDGSRNLLLRILQMLMAPLGYDKSIGRQRATVVVETLPTLATVTTVTTVTSVSNIGGIGGYSAQMTVFDQNRSAWAQCVRARIT